MGRGTVREIIWDRQEGKCEYCGRSLSVNGMILHHYVNRSAGGSNGPEFTNLKGRHASCEREAHRLYKHGNPAEGKAGRETTKKRNVGRRARRTTARSHQQGRRGRQAGQGVHGELAIRITIRISRSRD